MGRTNEIDCRTMIVDLVLVIQGAIHAQKGRDARRSMLDH